MEVLVVGGTGTVGSRVARALAERGHAVRVLTRGSGAKNGLPEGARPVAGSLQQPETLPAAFSGADAAFLLTPLAEDETEQGLAGVRAARDGGVPRLVFMSVVLPDDSHHIPHFASKAAIEAAVRDGPFEWTILRPNSFFQNDLRYREAMLRQGVYPQPIGSRGVSRVDVRDIADAATIALTSAHLQGRVVPVHGPEAMSGEAVAETWTRHLGRDVRYVGDDLEAWERGARQVMPAWLARDLRIMYAYFHERGFIASDAELEALREILGRELRRFDDFAAETTAIWRD